MHMRQLLAGLLVAMTPAAAAAATTTASTTTTTVATTAAAPLKLGLLHASVWEKAAACCAAAQEAAASVGAELLCRDTEGRAIAAVRAYEELVAWGATAVLGPSFSSETEVVSQFATEHGVPLVSYSAEASSLSSKDVHPLVFRVNPPLTRKLQGVVALARHYGWRRLGLLHVDDAFGVASTELLHMIDVAEVVKLPRWDNATMKEAVRRLKAARVGVVVVVAYEVHVQALMAAAGEHDYCSGVAWLLHEPVTSVLDATTTACLSGALTFSWPRTYDTGAAAALAEAVPGLNEYAFFAHDAVLAVAEAARVGGALADVTVDGASGLVAFDARLDPRFVVPMELSNLRSGEYATVASFPWAGSLGVLFPGQTAVVPADVRWEYPLRVLVPRWDLS